MQQVWILKCRESEKPLPVQEIMESEYAEALVDTTIKTEIKVHENRRNVFMCYKGKRVIILIAVGITTQDILQNLETEKTRKHKLLANELNLLY